jgi:hypothetical protein
MNNQVFFDEIRKSLFKKLSEDQVKGMEAILRSCHRNNADLYTAAYSLATAYHEVGGRMVPVREGFASTNQGAINAVTNLYNRGGISTNYALPSGPYNKNYYGRGFVQITWYDNYRKLGKRLGVGDQLAKNPDMALDYDFGADLLVVGIKEGLYRKHKMSDFVTDSGVDYFEARNIINGDKNKKPRWLNGKRIGTAIEKYAIKFEGALKAAGYGSGAKVSTPPEKPLSDALIESSEGFNWVELVVKLIKSLFGGK